MFVHELSGYIIYHIFSVLKLLFQNCMLLNWKTYVVLQKKSHNNKNRITGNSFLNRDVLYTSEIYHNRIIFADYDQLWFLFKTQSINETVVPTRGALSTFRCTHVFVGKGIVFLKGLFKHSSQHKRYYDIII